MTERSTTKMEGIAYTALAFFVWGILPVYWKGLRPVPALEILAHRILWSFILTVVILALTKKLSVFAYLKDPRTRRTLLLTGGLIGLNWLAYVYAVNSGQIVEASLGYYINPILSVMLGIVVLRERLNLIQIVAFVLACSGVLYLTLDHGRFPWISVLLAVAFALYGLLKKTSDVDPMSGLMIETMLLLPLAIGVIAYQAIQGRGAFLTVSAQKDLLFVFAGVVTTMPLYWFAQGARRIRLSSVGFLQYIAPTLMLCIAVCLYGEAFTAAHKISFGLVWCGLILYTVHLFRGTET